MMGWGSREGDETMARHLASIPKWGTREKRKSISIWHFSGGLYLAKPYSAKPEFAVQQSAKPYSAKPYSAKPYSTKPTSGIC